MGFYYSYLHSKCIHIYSFVYIVCNFYFYGNTHSQRATRLPESSWLHITGREAHDPCPPGSSRIRLSSLDIGHARPDPKTGTTDTPSSRYAYPLSTRRIATRSGAFPSYELSPVVCPSSLKRTSRPRYRSRPNSSPPRTNTSSSGPSETLWTRNE